MIATQLPTLIGYPAAPTNGGRLDASTPQKVGAWAWEPKADEVRCVIHASTRRVWNQYGEVFSDTHKIGKALDQLQALSMNSFFDWLDVGVTEKRHDMMRGCVIVFDMIRSPSSASDWTLEERRVHLEAVLPTLPPAPVLLQAGTVNDRIYLIDQYREPKCKPLELQAYLQSCNEQVGRKFYEGLVAKRLDSMYPLGQRPKTKTPMWIKHRFDQP